MTAPRNPQKRNTIPGVYQYQTRRGKRWGVVYDVAPDWETGVRRQKRKVGFLTQDEAHSWQVARLHSRNRGDVEIEASTLPLGKYLSEWLDGMVELSPGTRRSYRNYLVWIIEALGDVPLGKLTARQIETCLADRLKTGVSATVVRDAHRVLKQALRRAVYHDLLRTNPCDRVKPPSPKPHHPKTWTQDEMRRFLKIQSEDLLWGDFWQVLCETWMRVAEITDLRWSDFDYAAGTITVNHAVHRDEHYQYVSGTVKTLKSNRVIPVSPHLIALLRERQDRIQPASLDGLVFRSSQKGSWISSQVVARALGIGCEQAGVPVLTTHEVRHSGGSIAYRAGENIKIVSERLGHKDVRFTMAVYISTNDDDHRQAATRIADLIRGQSDRGVIDNE